MACGVSRSQAWRPSCGMVSIAKYFAANSRSGTVSSGHGSPVRGASATGTASPESSTPRSSPYSTPSSTTTAILGSWRSWDQRRLRVIEYSQSEVPSQVNQRAPMCGRPSADTVATRQVRCSAR